jgi:thymidine phosphorylase
VGFSDILPEGAEVTQGMALARVHAATDVQAEQAATAFLAACQIGHSAAPARPVILGRIC